MQDRALAKEYEGLIHYAARHYGAAGHPILEYSDLVQEGWQVFSKILKEHAGVDPETFGKIFKASLFNHLKTLLEAQRYTKKRAVEQVEYQEELLGQSFDDIAYAHYIHHVKQILAHNPDAVRLFENLLEPADEIVSLAIAESDRRNRLKEKGLRQRGSAVVAVKPGHIRRYLRLSQQQFEILLAEVKSVVRSVVCERYLTVSV